MIKIEAFSILGSNSSELSRKINNSVVKDYNYRYYNFPDPEGGLSGTVPGSKIDPYKIFKDNLI